jgi:subtilisin family serine protease
VVTKTNNFFKEILMRLLLLPALLLLAFATQSVSAAERYIVKCSAENGINCLSTEKGLQKVTPIHSVPGMFIVEFSATKEALTAKVDALSEKMEYLVKDKEIKLNDPIDAYEDPNPEAYALTLTKLIDLHKLGILGSKKVVVAVIDTGVDYNNKYLKNIWTNKGEIPNNGIDDDKNGFIDDVHGFNFVANSGDPMDDHKHGTHCSGTIAGSDGIGFAPNIVIMPVKFLSAQGSGSLADAVKAIDYATINGANIMSNSWGGGGFEQPMLDVIKKAGEKGIIFVAAAGNDGSDNDATPSYPASYQSDNVIAVAASDKDDKMAEFSNWGLTSVVLAAPGVDIISSVPGDKLEKLSGTSMATPAVSGTVALMLSVNPKLTVKEVKEILIQSVDKVDGFKVISGGRLNAYNAVCAAGKEQHICDN